MYRQIILIKEFKRFVCDDIKTYLDEQKVQNLTKEVACAYDNALTHKSTFNKNRSFGSTKKSYPEVGKKTENVAPEKSSDKGQTSNQTMSNDRKPRSFAPVCYYCKKPGHIMSDCWLLKKRREKRRQHPMPLCLANLTGVQIPIEHNLELVKTSLRLLGRSSNLLYLRALYP